MILTLLFIGMVILGLFGFIVCYKIDDKCYNLRRNLYYENKYTKEKIFKLKKFYSKLDDIFNIIEALFISILIIFSVVLFFSSIVIFINLGTKDRDYQIILKEKEMLEYRLEHKEDNVVGNEMLYNDILSFNQRIYISKRNQENYWINWYCNDKIATIEYIDYKNYDN